MLPILIALFLISYGLMAMLVVEQGRTIDSQRNLIRDIFGDSAQLNAMKMSAIQKQNQALGRRQAPSSQTRSNQSTQTPPSQATQQDKAKNGKATRLRKVIPQKPPMAASDSPDIRRNVAHI
jgi:Tfp pilus assembly protein PilV